MVFPKMEYRVRKYNKGECDGVDLSRLQEGSYKTCRGLASGRIQFAYDCEKAEICTNCGHIMIGKYGYRLSKDDWMGILLDLSKVRENFDLFDALHIVNRMKNEGKSDMEILKYVMIFA